MINAILTAGGLSLKCMALLDLSKHNIEGYFGSKSVNIKTAAAELMTTVWFGLPWHRMAIL